MRYTFGLGQELSCYKLTNYLIADQALLRALQEKELSEFISQLIEDIPRRLCMDKRKRPTLRNNVRNNRSYYNSLTANGLQHQTA